MNEVGQEPFSADLKINASRTRDWSPVTARAKVGNNPLLLTLAAACSFVPWVFITSWDDSFYLPKLIALWIVLTVALWSFVLGTLRRRRSHLSWMPLVDIPVIGFLTWNILAWALSSDRHQSLFGERLQHQGLLTLLLYVGFFYLARIAVNKLHSLLLVFRATSLGAVVVSIYAIAQKIGLDPVWKGYLPSGRVFASIGQPNALAAYLVLSLPAAIVLGWKSRRFWRAAWFSAATYMVIALFLTSSRGGDIGLVGALGTLGYFLLRDPQHRRRLLQMAAVTSVLLIVACVALAPLTSLVHKTWNRAYSITSLSNDQSISNHLDQWKVAILIIERNPLVGTGPETFPLEFPTYSRMVLPPSHVAYFDQFRVESPHNEFLAIADGSGLPAAAIYLFMLFGTGLVLWRASKEMGESGRLAVLTIAAMMVGHVLTDSFMSAEITGSWLFWTILGAGIGLSTTMNLNTLETTSDA